MGGEGGGTVNAGSLQDVGLTVGLADAHVVDDKRVKMAGQGVDIFHHAFGAMENGEVIAHQFLGPAPDLVDFAIVFKNLL